VDNANIIGAIAVRRTRSSAFDMLPTAPTRSRAIARDTGGNRSTSTINVNINNPSATNSSAVSIATPIQHATVSGLVTVSATATDNVALWACSFEYDNANIIAGNKRSPYSFIGNSTLLVNGAHTISAIARDGAAMSQLLPSPSHLNFDQ